LHSTGRGPGFAVGATLYTEPIPELWFLPIPRENVRFYAGVGWRYGDLPARYSDFDFRGWESRIGMAVFLGKREPRKTDEGR
jgi:hypothetical protein